MNTKLIIISFLVFALSYNIKGQLTWGLRGGVTSSNIDMSVKSNNYIIDYNKGNYGWHAGLIGQFKAAKFFVQPELLFSTAKFDLAYKNTTNSTDNELGEQKIRKIDLPILVGFKLSIFKLQAGPVATWILASQSDLLDEKKIDQSFYTSTIGYQAGIGVELSSLLIDFKYESNVSKLSDEITIKDISVKTDQRMSQFIFSIGYLF